MATALIKMVRLCVGASAHASARAMALGEVRRSVGQSLSRTRWAAACGGEKWPLLKDHHEHELDLFLVS